MKKVLFLSALCAMALCSCSKDNDENEGNSFGRAEIRFELAGPQYQGTPSSDILNYSEFIISGTDFEGNKIRKNLCTGAQDTVIVCTKAPTKDKSIFAVLGVNPSASTYLPKENFNVDYSFRVTYAIYDKSGKQISSGFVTQSSTTGIMSSTEFQNEVVSNWMNKKFELYYDEIDGKMDYGFAWQTEGDV